MQASAVRRKSPFSSDPADAPLTLTALLWSSSFAIGRAVRDDISPTATKKAASSSSERLVHGGAQLHPRAAAIGDDADREVRPQPAIATGSQRTFILQRRLGTLAAS
jgi:hypothetical protein